MRHAQVRGRMLYRLTMLAMALLPLLGTLVPLPSVAADHPENWCADAVDFAMRTAQYRSYGRSQQYTAKSIEHDSDVFIQQYPDLSKADMQHIAGRERAAAMPTELAQRKGGTAAEIEGDVEATAHREVGAASRGVGAGDPQDLAGTHRHRCPRR